MNSMSQLPRLLRRFLSFKLNLRYTSLLPSTSAHGLRTHRYHPRLQIAHLFIGLFDRQTAHKPPPKPSVLFSISLLLSYFSLRLLLPYGPSRLLPLLPLNPFICLLFLLKFLHLLFPTSQQTYMSRQTLSPTYRTLSRFSFILFSSLLSPFQAA